MRRQSNKNKTSTIEEQACVYASLVLQDDDAKFFSHFAEQKIKAAGGTRVLVAKGIITCVDSARKLSFEKCRDQHVYKIISTITGVDAFRIAAFLEVGSP
ncbi:hypothetical protein PRIPAC_98110 [Pristionchus pacificus]|uniref:Uncharacterized protein n=1 Tax=Pristionchus pacificus TaxID=54126 RepID=A0A2A6BYA1_PRIPA|nr:hypothetical protein PRIPAC_98110 [Pristionchus pacificus]|eukprot:PDM70868.1 hypothetical protein PRIPAC_44484 [Pristionchus pacificus]